MTFDEWVAREGAYLNDEDDASKAARLMAGVAWSVAKREARDQMSDYAAQQVAAERERCANACREWQAGRLSHGIGTHDLLRSIEAPNVEVTCPPRAGHRSNDEHDQA